MKNIASYKKALSPKQREEAPTRSPFAPASPDDLDKQHELRQFLTPNPVAEFVEEGVEVCAKA